MTEEDNQNTNTEVKPQEGAPVNSVDTNQAADSFTLEEIEKLNKEIEEAKKQMVSEDVEKKIMAEREAAKKEAEKEFLVNQKIKDLEREKLELQQKNEAVQRQTSQQLESLKAQVDRLMSSKAVITQDNPFKREPQPDVNKSVDMMDEATIDKIEEKSFEAFMESKSRI
jgi:hypothetical protein